MSTGSISPLVSVDGIVGMARGDLGHLLLIFGGTGLRQTNGSSLLGKILTNKNLIYLYLHFLVICKSLIARLSKSIMFNIFLKWAN